MVDRTKRVKRKLRRPKLKFDWSRLLTILVLTGLFLGLGLVVYVSATLPTFNPDLLSGANSTLLYDEKGELFSSLHAGENRTEVGLEKVPPVMRQAFLATEDRDFYKHHGVNFRGIARAVFSNVQSGDMTGQGASTITQQLARSSFLTTDKNWLRKIKEVFLAFKIESAYTKDEILEMYLNKIYFGAGAYGVQAAANTYFGKDVGSLTLPESALIAGLVQSPNNYNPFTNLEKAKARQKQVLNSMVAAGYINEAAATQAYDTALILAKTQSSGSKYGFFVDAVIDEAIQILSGVKGYSDPESAVYKSSLKIYTTVNAPLQAYAEEYFKNSSNFPVSSKSGVKIQTGMAVIENESGEIKAIMGGRDYEQQRGFNRATNAYRQPGSSIKPLTVYTPALEEGKMPFLVLDDSPVSYKTSTGTWSPKNYDGSNRGLITMRTAVQYSVNTFAVQTLDLVGVRHGFDMGKSLGLSLVDTPGTNDLNLAALALGGLTKGVTPVMMAGAYAGIANDGIFNRPHFITKIVDTNGVTVYQYKPQAGRVMSSETAWLMGNMLQTVVSSGTGTNAKINNVPTAGKTGTTENMTDVWFCGFTPVYSAAVWMGYDDQNNKMVNAYGGGYPALMFKAMLQKAHQGVKAGGWPTPQDIVQVSVCTKSGMLPGPLCPTDQVQTEFCLKSYVPTTTCNIHENVVICQESKQLATKYCPATTIMAAVKVGPNSTDKNRAPTESCPLHTDFAVSGLLKNTVKICTDPRHGGQLFAANVPNLFQSGGCPSKLVYEIVLPKGQKLPACSLADHQVRKK